MAQLRFVGIQIWLRTPRARRVFSSGGASQESMDTTACNNGIGDKNSNDNINNQEQEER